MVVNLFCILNFALATPTYAQVGNLPPCNGVMQVKIATDSLKEKILNKFISDCVNNNWFNRSYDKGIIHLYEYFDTKGNLCWYLSPLIDDRYKDNPPNRFSDFRGDIILVYDADSTGRVRMTAGDKDAKNHCLEQIIGDRVFTRPTQKTRWTSDVIPYINKNRSEGNRRIMTGGGGAIIVRFTKDGKYVISPLS